MWDFFFKWANRLKTYGVTPFGNKITHDPKHLFYDVFYKISLQLISRGGYFLPL